jgi:hypothetical protein
MRVQSHGMFGIDDAQVPAHTEMHDQEHVVIGADDDVLPAPPDSGDLQPND